MVGSASPPLVAMSRAPHCNCEFPIREFPIASCNRSRAAPRRRRLLAQPVLLAAIPTASCLWGKEVKHFPHVSSWKGLFLDSGSRKATYQRAIIPGGLARIREIFAAKTRRAQPQRRVRLAGKLRLAMGSLQDRMLPFSVLQHGRHLRSECRLENLASGWPAPLRSSTGKPVAHIACSVDSATRPATLPFASPIISAFPQGSLSSPFCNRTWEDACHAPEITNSRSASRNFPLITQLISPLPLIASPPNCHSLLHVKQPAANHSRGNICVEYAKRN